MKVLFAIGQNPKNIVDRYYEKYNETLEYKTVFYFKALIEEVKKDKSYDIIVIHEDLEQYEPKDLEQIDRKLFSYVDRITDEIQDSEIIYICSDRRTREDSFVVRLYSIGIYNLLLGDDRKINHLCEIIKKPKTKREAKEYLNIDTSSINETGIMRDDEVDEGQMMNILNFYDSLRGQPEKYVETFDKISGQYSRAQLKVIASMLPKEVQGYIYAEPKYRYLVDNAGASQLADSKNIPNVKKSEERSHSQNFLGVFKKIKNKSNNKTVNESIEDANTRLVKQQNRAKIELEQRKLEEQAKKEQEELNRKMLEEQKRKEEEEIEKKRLDEIAKIEQEDLKQRELEIKARKEQEELNRRKLEEQKRKEQEEIEKKRLDEIAKIEQENLKQRELEIKARKEQEELNRRKLEEQQRREQEEIAKAKIEQENLAKKKLEEELNKQTFVEDNNSVNNLYNNQNNYEKTNNDIEVNVDKNINDDIEKVVNTTVINAHSLTEEQIRFKNEQEKLAIEQEKIRKVQAELEEEKRKLREEQARLENERKQVDVVPITKEVNKYYETTPVIAYDYKKMVVFVGANKAGTSFAVNAVANNLVNQKILTSILDMTKDKGMYYMYNQSDKGLRKIASECMQRLSENEDYFMPISKYLKVYTTIPGTVSDSRRSFKHKAIIDTVKNNCNVTIVDADFTTPIDYFEQASEIYIIQDMDILKIQDTTMFLREMKNRNVDMNKIRVIVNKFVKNSLTPRKIMEGLAYYKDPEMTFVDTLLSGKVENYIIPYNLSNYSRYIESLCKGVISFKGFTPDFEEAINEICMHVYPRKAISKRNKGGLFG